MKNLLVILGILLLSFHVKAQDSGENLFDDSFLHEIRLSFDQPDYWTQLNDNYNQNPVEQGNPVPYIIGDVIIDGQLVDSVGVRMKGFTSFWTDSDKKPLKIDFNEFVPGQKFDGLRKLNLNNGTGDAAMVRDNIAYDLLRSIGVKAPRTAHAEVYINDVYWGMYQLIEQVDKEFLKDNFSNDNGNLFKNKAWSKFEYNGNSKTDYNNIFELKTNRDEDDWTGFINLMDFLNNSTDEEFTAGIGEIFNVELFLKTLAVDVAILNWDSYLDHGRNWYVYEDVTTGVFHWIPWDYNLSLEGQLGGFSDGCNVFPEFIGWTNESTTVKFLDISWTSGEPTYEWDFGDGGFSTEAEPEHTYEMEGNYTICLKVTSDGECTEEVCNTISTSYNYNECPSIVDGTFPHEASEAFVKTIAWNPTCCDVWGEDCIDIYGFFSNSNEGEDKRFLIDQSENEGVLINRLFAVPQFKEQYNSIFCDLLENHYDAEKYNDYITERMALINDGVVADPNFLYSYNEFVSDSGPEGLSLIISERIAALKIELADQYDCALTFVNVDFQDVAINEYLASNDSTSNYVDEAGEHDDWIELYNNTQESVDLSGVYLSDNSENLAKWKFPDNTSIEPGGFLIVWADKDDDQPGLHADFKLSKESDEIYLTNSDGSFIDSTGYTIEQIANISMARIPNGTGNFISQDPTFGSNNETTSTSDIRGNVITVYPVPTANILNVNLDNNTEGKYQVSVFSVSGQEMIRNISLNAINNTVDVRELNPGFYFLVLTAENGKRESLKFTKVN